MITVTRSESYAVDTVVFDLGGVLIDWNPRYLYRKLIPDEAALEYFLAEICTAEWNHLLDAGRPLGEGISELFEKHPNGRRLSAPGRSVGKRWWPAP